MFVSNLNAKMAQRFMNLVLLPHVRMDIQENRRLHHALFQALKKAAYKPDAFYKVSGSPASANFSAACLAPATNVLMPRIRIHLHLPPWQP